MVDTIFIPPVFYVSFLACLQKNLLPGLAQGNDQQNLVFFSNCKERCQLLSVNSSQYTAPKPLLYRCQQYALGCNPMITAKGIGDGDITQDNNIGPWSFPFLWAIPVF